MKLRSGKVIIKNDEGQIQPKQTQQPNKSPRNLKTKHTENNNPVCQTFQVRTQVSCLFKGFRNDDFQKKYIRNEYFRN